MMIYDFCGCLRGKGMHMMCFRAGIAMGCNGLRWVAICSFEPLRDCSHAQCVGAPAKVVQRSGQRVQAVKEKKEKERKGREKKGRKEGKKEGKKEMRNSRRVMKWNEGPECSSL